MRIKLLCICIEHRVKANSNIEYLRSSDKTVSHSPHVREEYLLLVLTTRRVICFFCHFIEIFLKCVWLWLRSQNKGNNSVKKHILSSNWLYATNFPSQHPLSFSTYRTVYKPSLPFCICRTLCTNVF